MSNHNMQEERYLKKEKLKTASLSQLKSTQLVLHFDEKKLRTFTPLFIGSHWEFYFLIFPNQKQIDISNFMYANGAAAFAF